MIALQLCRLLGVFKYIRVHVHVALAIARRRQWFQHACTHEYGLTGTFSQQFSPAASWTPAALSMSSFSATIYDRCPGNVYGTG